MAQSRPPRAPGLWSRWVRRLRIALPLGGLALLSLIFLAPREARFSIGVDLSPAEIARLGAGLRLTNPRIAGATRAGEPYVVTADAAVPDGPNPDVIDLERVDAEINLSDGRVLTLLSDTGSIQPKIDALKLRGDVRLSSSDGYLMTAPSADVDLKAQELIASGPVTGSGPPGDIEAAAMRGLRKDAETGAGRIWFTGGVKVRINPRSTAPEE